MQSDPLIRDRTAADLLGVSVSTVWRWASEGTIPGPIRIANTSRWRRSEIEAVINRAAAERVAA
ncbi:helix-turn-helix transcriptional regulator [Wenxinia saemankumensis]|uniref:Transcriptional regulator, AlpA family n=1 Tax=Wenxinia saemankumensis TaxID=1447782 RepID=A0A1M6HPY5_9RHOB|nr:helix-turn-helix domain-containing protein [Wenxinia saemankumensis]SHJ24259.1 transcriptional regulator, AlpA family [Wenxinia saemankumensis]